MGLFGKLFGSSGRSESGYGALPQHFQTALTDMVGQAGRTLLGGRGDEMFTPMGITPDEQQAFELMRSGLAPTAEGLSDDIGMLMNPYDQYVIDDINREAQGANSILQQNLDAAGQFGSNRQFLGAGDIENRRLNQIGQFRQGQYNRALDTALGRLIDLRGMDINNLMQIGGMERGLDLQTKQAPLEALRNYAQFMSAIPGSSYTRQADPGMLNRMSGFVRGVMTPPGDAGGMAGATGAGGMQQMASLAALSDIREKEDINKIGEIDGINLYTYKIKGSNKTQIGVMAQEIEQIKPEAVTEINGRKHVYYDRIWRH